MNKVNGLPIFDDKRYSYSERDMEIARINNSFVRFGTDPSFIPKGDVIIFLEYVQHAGSLIIKDKDSQAVSGDMGGTLDLTHSPLRLAGGVILTGTITLAKGYYIQK